MNYKQIYDNIINYRLDNPLNGYTERHHILPRSLGGNDDKSNLVDLSAREHYICHLLLTKIYPKGSQEYYKMVNAYIMMCNIKNYNQKRYFKVNSKLYEHYKIIRSYNMSNEQAGDKNSQYGTKWVNNKKLRISKKVSHNFILEDGWENGRVIDFSFLDKCCINCNINLGCKSNKELKTMCDVCRKVLSNTQIEKMRKTKLNKKCSCDGIIYESISDASRILGLSFQVVQARIKSTKNKNYFFV